MSVTVAKRAPAGLVYRARAGDLLGLRPLLEEAHPKMALLLHGVDWTLEHLPLAAEFPMTYVLVSETVDGPHAYCWVEVLGTGDLFVHQIYVRQGTNGRPLWAELQRVAKRERCRSIMGVTFRRGGVRALRRYGFAPVGTLIRKEL